LLEGQTERIFIENLLNEYFTHPFFNIESVQLIEGKATSITKANYDHDDVRLYFLIYDVMGDGNVNGAINERSETLLNNRGYSHIIGIRDLYPQPIGSLPLMLEAFNDQFRDKEYFDKLTQIIAIMEIEAWFLADYNHFAKMDQKLVPEFINENLNIDILNDDLETYSHPSQTLNRIWNLVDRTYRKRESDSHSICSHFDYSFFCCNEDLLNRIPSFARLLSTINQIT
jgi:hypothetical protein